MAYPYIFIPLYLAEVTLLVLLSFRVLKGRVRPKRVGLTFLYFFFFLLVFMLPLGFIADIIQKKGTHILSSFFITGLFLVAFSEEMARFFILRHSRKDNAPVKAWEMGMVVALFETHQWLFMATPENITEFGLWGVVGIFLLLSLTYVMDMLGHTLWSHLQIRFLLESALARFKKVFIFFLIVLGHTSFNMTLFFLLEKAGALPS